MEILLAEVLLGWKTCIARLFCEENSGLPGVSQDFTQHIPRDYTM
jgi:hypothetical protein